MNVCPRQNPGYSIMNNRKKLEEKIRNAKHQRKSDADNAVVFYDEKGNWIFEIYTSKHKVKNIMN